MLKKIDRLINDELDVSAPVKYTYHTGYRRSAKEAREIITDFRAEVEAMRDDTQSFLNKHKSALTMTERAGMSRELDVLAKILAMIDGGQK